MTQCYCPSYHFPHRKGGGKCIWSKYHTDYLCVACGQACVPQKRLEAETSEHFGQKRTDTHAWVESDCCKAEVIYSGKLVRSEDII